MDDVLKSVKGVEGKLFKMEGNMLLCVKKR